MPDKKSELTLSDILSKAINIEKTAEEMYKNFAELFSDFKEISDFWNGMSNDELNHAKWLSKIKESLSEQELISVPENNSSIITDNINILLSKNSAKKINNLDDAYELAHELEYSEVNNLFRLLMNNYLASEERKKFIFSEIKEHLEKIMNFPKYFGDKKLRKKITVKKT